MRPTDLTQEVLTEIVELVEIGAMRSDTAKAVGVHPGTLARWIARGEVPAEEFLEGLEGLDRATLLERARKVAPVWKHKRVQVSDELTEDELRWVLVWHEEPYRALAAGIKRAEGRAKAYAVGRIRAAMPKHWQAAAWYLERTDPETFGQRVRTTIEKEDSSEVDREIEELARELGVKARRDQTPVPTE